MISSSSRDSRLASFQHDETVPHEHLAGGGRAQAGDERRGLRPACGLEQRHRVADRRRMRRAPPRTRPARAWSAPRRSGTRCPRRRCRTRPRRGPRGRGASARRARRAAPKGRGPAATAGRRRRPAPPAGRRSRSSGTGRDREGRFEPRGRVARHDDDERVREQVEALGRAHEALPLERVHLRRVGRDEHVGRRARADLSREVARGPEVEKRASSRGRLPCRPDLGQRVGEAGGREDGYLLAPGLRLRRERGAAPPRHSRPSADAAQEPARRKSATGHARPLRRGC